MAVDPIAAIGVIVDAAWYAARYRDVAEADALRHFVAHGLAEGRDPNPYFDGVWYLREYPDAAEPPLLHYLQTGAAALRDPHPRFDAVWYVGKHPQARGNPLLHHMTTGAANGWPTEPAPDFAAFRPGGWVCPAVLVVADDPTDAASLMLRTTSRGLRLLAPGGRVLLLPAQRIGELVRLLRQLDVRRVDIRDLAAGRFDLRSMLHGLDVPFDLTMRDYLALCPQRYLLPWPDSQYCGEPGPAGCNACIAARPSHGATDILTWRRGHAWLFREADRVICPSFDALARLRRHGLAARAVVAPSGGGVWPQSFPTLSARSRLRVAVPGGAAHQGAPTIAAMRAACIDVRVVAREDWAATLRGSRVHIAWFPAQWPDPDADGLNAALDVGLPVVAAGIGAFPERLAGRRLTWLVEPGAAPRGWLDAFAAARAALSGTPAKPRRRPKRAAAGPADAAPSRASGVIDLRRAGRVCVVVLPERFENGTPSPCGYIRLLQPLDHLAAEGQIDMVLADPSEALRYRADVIATQRYALPDAASADALAAHCRVHGIRLLYDLDDDLLQVPRDHPEARILRPRARLVARMLGHADAIWVSTEALRQALGPVARKARVVANGLDGRLWADPPRPIRTSDGMTRILYMGTATHDADLAVVEPALARLHTEFCQRVRIDLIGVTARGDLPPWVHRVVPPAPARASYPGFVDWMIRRHWDIGIAPLADTGFNHGKSAIKTLDYAALGLAVLASDVPAYRGSSAPLVGNTEAEWFGALARLVRDPGLRLAQAREARDSFTRNGTLAAQAPARREALLALADEKISPSRRARGRA